MLINVDIDFKDNFSAYILRWIPPCGKIADWLQISTDYYTKTLEFRTSLLYSKFLSSKIFDFSVKFGSKTINQNVHEPKFLSNTEIFKECTLFETSSIFTTFILQTISNDKVRGGIEIHFIRTF